MEARALLDGGFRETTPSFRCRAASLETAYPRTHRIAQELEARAHDEPGDSFVTKVLHELQEIGFRFVQERHCGSSCPPEVGVGLSRCRG